MNKSFALILIALTVVRSFDVEIDYGFSESVAVKNFVWPLDAAAMETIPDKEEIWFTDALIDIVPHNFTNQLKRCINLNFLSGKVRTVHVSTSHEVLLLWGSATENIIIERGMDYKLSHFYTNNISITRLPDNLSQLKKLTYLSFEDTSIDYILLDQLNGLERLKTLLLSCNRIKSLHSDSLISLPQLSKFHLDQNQLEQVDTCSWSMPSLQELILFSNNLTNIVIGRFPTLNKLSLELNPLNCGWMNKFMNSPWYNYQHIACNEQSKGDFSLECPAEMNILREQQITELAEQNQHSEFKNNENGFENTTPLFSSTDSDESEKRSDVPSKLDDDGESKEKSINEVVERCNNIEKNSNAIERLTSEIIKLQNVMNELVSKINNVEMENTGKPSVN